MGKSCVSMTEQKNDYKCSECDFKGTIEEVLIHKMGHDD